MTRKSIFVEVEPSVIKWAVDSAGFGHKEISKKISEKENLIDEWINKNSKPTFKQLERLASIVKRPVASLLLSKAPVEKPFPKDYRMLPGNQDKFDKKTFSAIRKARSLQNASKELSIYINEEIKSKIKKRSLNNDPKEIAEIYRDIFNLTEKSQTKFRDHYKFYNYLRTELEKINIFPFQTSMPLEDARGFALSDDEPSVIMVNSKDIVEARIFTLMHEFAHILLGETGIDIPEFRSDNKIEKWCNEFASNFLLPKRIAKKIFEENKEKLTETKTLNSMSRKYCVSKAMLLYNMVLLEYINWDIFSEITNRFKVNTEEQVSVGIPMEKKRLSEMGNKFVSLVAGNLDNKNITYSDALGYLSIKSRKLNKLLSKAKT